MRKSLLLLAVGVLLLTGCSSSSEKVMHCTRTTDQSGMKMNFDYKVTYKDDEVISLEANESIEADDEATLETLKESVQAQYDNYNELEHYDASVEVKDGKLISKLEVNYSKIDKDKLFEKDSANKQYFKDGKASLEAFKQVYSQLGLTCEE